MQRKIGIMNKTVLASSLLVCASAVSAGDMFSSNVALTSDYQFRGISQTFENPAIQGGFDLAHPSGVYAGLWGSNVDFQVQTVDDAQLELDIYAGYKGEITKDLGWSVGFIHYAYPGSASSLNYDFTEVNAGLTYGPFSAKWSHSSDFFFASGKSDYLEAAYTVSLPQDFALGFHIGKQKIEKNSVFGTPDYVDYKFGVSKKFGGFNFELAYVDTDIKKSECFAATNLCDGRVILTVSR